MAPIFADSQERWRATASERRIHGGNTVTRFLVGFVGSAPSAWVAIKGYGPTPGERKTYAMRECARRQLVTQ